MSYVQIPESLEGSGICWPFTLPNDISAVQIQAITDSETRLSPVSKLPRGARIEPCGRGFNANTLKICCEGQFYFVFTRELGGLS